jgi:hypothetical protein
MEKSGGCQCVPPERIYNFKEKTMIRHIVLFWLKDKSPANIEATAQKLRSMTGKIEGMLTLQVGIDCAHTERSCDLCLMEEFDTMESLERYRTHPVHLPIQAHMHAVRESSYSADYIVK